MTVDIYQSSSEDALSPQEVKLYWDIMDYRAAHGLPAIPVSAALTTTAARHGLDQVENMGGYPVGEPGENKAHGWSDARYDGRDISTAPAMWNAPQRLGTGYGSYGFEIAVGYLGSDPGVDMTPETALNSWQGSSPHNAVILNQSPWDSVGYQWQAIGIGIYKQVSDVWFGTTPDPTGTPSIVGTDEGESVKGFAGSDTIRMGGGNDSVSGGDGDDVIYGNEGDDLIYGNVGDDLLAGNTGRDLVYAGRGRDQVYGGQDDDVLVGNLDDDTLVGNLGNDQLFGGQGNDMLVGGQGADTLIGGLGHNTLVGGQGADTYVFAPGEGTDVIQGFNQADGDRLDIGGESYTVGSATDGSALIALSGGHTIDLADITRAQVDASFFAPAQT